MLKETTKTKKMIQDAIGRAIAAISEEIQNGGEPGETLTRAEAIKRLAEAYRKITVKRIDE